MGPGGVHRPCSRIRSGYSKVRNRIGCPHLRHRIVAHIRVDIPRLTSSGRTAPLGPGKSDGRRTRLIARHVTHREVREERARTDRVATARVHGATRCGHGVACGVQTADRFAGGVEHPPDGVGAQTALVPRSEMPNCAAWNGPFSIGTRPIHHR